MLRRGDRDDAVAEALQRTRHAVAGARRVGRQAHHGDGAGRAQQLLDLCLGRVREHALRGLRGCGRLVYPLRSSRSRSQGARFLSQDFKVRIEPHGRTVPVAPGQALLEAALAAGLNLPHSCKSGHCGSCRARLLAGTVSYPAGRPLGITREEQESGYILLCQARAQEDVAVEARLIANVDDVEIKTLPCRIARRVMLAPDVMQVWLRLPAVERLHFQPGQYLDVLLEGGRRRSFSIASPPHDSALLELHVRQRQRRGIHRSAVR